MLPKLDDGTGRGVFWGAVAAGGITFAVVTLVTWEPLVACAAALVALIPGVLLGFLIGGLYLPPTPAPANRTLGGLTREVAAINHERFAVEPAPVTEGDPIWERLCRVIAEQLGVRQETLRRDTRFVEDLRV